MLPSKKHISQLFITANGISFYANTYLHVSILGKHLPATYFMHRRQHWIPSAFRFRELCPDKSRFNIRVHRRKSHFVI